VLDVRSRRQPRFGAGDGHGVRPGRAGEADRVGGLLPLGEGQCERGAEAVARAGGVNGSDRRWGNRAAVGAGGPRCPARAERDDGDARGGPQSDRRGGAVELLTGERARLDLVRHDHRRRRGELGREVVHGCGVQHHGPAPLADDAGGVQRGLGGHLALHEEHVAVGQRRAVGDGELPVRARVLHERHVAVGGDERHGHRRGRAAQLDHLAGVDALPVERREEGVAMRVAADGPDHRDVGAEAREGDRLVVALAAPVDGVVCGDDDLAGLGARGHAEGEVHHERADDECADGHRGSVSSVVSP
jgi:hypothetical protein